MVLLSCLQAGKRQDGAGRVSGAEFTADFLVQAGFPHGKQIAFTHCLPSILLPGADITEFKSTLKSTSKTEKAYAHTRTHTHTHTHTHAPLCKKRFHGDETEKQHRRRRATETAIINLKN